MVEQSVERGRLIRHVVLGALGFIGVTAVAGGVEMVAFPDGNPFVRAEWLDHIPVVDNYVVPGLTLAGAVGGSALLAAVGLWRRPRWTVFDPIERATGRHWAWAATGAAGVVLGAWITLEVVLIPERSLIELLYGILAVGLVAACFSEAFKSSLPRSSGGRRRAVRTG